MHLLAGAVFFASFMNAKYLSFPPFELLKSTMNSEIVAVICMYLRIYRFSALSICFILIIFQIQENSKEAKLKAGDRSLSGVPNAG